MSLGSRLPAVECLWEGERKERMPPITSSRTEKLPSLIWMLSSGKNYLYTTDAMTDGGIFSKSLVTFFCVPGIKGHFKASFASRKGATNNLPEALTQVCRLHVTLSQIVVKVKHEQK